RARDAATTLAPAPPRAPTTATTAPPIASAPFVPARARPPTAATPAPDRPRHPAAPVPDRPPPCRARTMTRTTPAEAGEHAVGERSCGRPGSAARLAIVTPLPDSTDQPAGRVAAFLALDKTIIATSSAAAFSRPFFAGGLIKRGDGLRSAYAHFLF